MQIEIKPPVITYPRYISATQISTFLDCPLKYKTIYTGQAVRLPANLYIIYGSAIHHALEINYRQKITSRIDIPVADAISLFMTYFSAEAEKELGYGIDERVFRTLVMQGELMLLKYWEEVAPNIQPLLVEEKFEIKLESFDDVVIYGFFDLVTEDGWIIDHKNTGESTHKQWTQAYVDRMHQLTIYDLAYRKMFKKEPTGLRIDALKRLKKGPEIQSILSQRTPVQILALAQLMNRIKEMQKLDLWYPNLNHCDACDFSSTCSRLCM